MIFTLTNRLIKIAFSIKNKFVFLLFCLLFSVVLKSQNVETIFWQKNIYQDTLAPYFALVDIDGNFWSNDSLKGKVIVMNFWSIYCPPCITELPELNKLPAQYSSDSIIFISVLFEKGVNADSMIAKNQFNYHLVTNGLQIMSDYYNNCFPTHIIIDRNGIIRYNSCGVFNSEMLKPEIQKILNQTPN